ncbi:MAG: hypothetical protein J5993_04635 [Clostridia bacterium]|nr:hypothetical protein [Clostridia bacterium]
MPITYTRADFEKIKDRLKSMQAKGSVLLACNKTKRIVAQRIRIEGIYENFFVIEIIKKKCVERTTILYSDLLTGIVSLKEIEEEELLE